MLKFFTLPSGAYSTYGDLLNACQMVPMFSA